MLGFLSEFVNLKGTNMVLGGRGNAQKLTTDPKALVVSTSNPPENPSKSRLKKCMRFQQKTYAHAANVLPPRVSAHVFWWMVFQSAQKLRGFPSFGATVAAASLPRRQAGPASLFAVAGAVAAALSPRPQAGLQAHPQP